MSKTIVTVNGKSIRTYIPINTTEHDVGVGSMIPQNARSGDILIIRNTGTVNKITGCPGGKNLGPKQQQFYTFSAEENSWTTGYMVYSITNDIGYLNGWVAYDPLDIDYKPKIVVKDGVCYMTGLIKSGTSSQPAFIMPEELRPGTDIYGSSMEGTSPYPSYLLIIQKNGSVVPYAITGGYRSIAWSWVIGE